MPYDLEFALFGEVAVENEQRGSLPVRIEHGGDVEVGDVAEARSGKTDTLDRTSERRYLVCGSLGRDAQGVALALKQPW